MRQDEPLSRNTIKALLDMPQGSWTRDTFEEARGYLHLSKVALAEKLGYSSRSISNIENGDTPMPRVVELAMRYLLLNFLIELLESGGLLSITLSNKKAPPLAEARDGAEVTAPGGGRGA